MLCNIFDIVKIMKHMLNIFFLLHIFIYPIIIHFHGKMMNTAH